MKTLKTLIRLSEQKVEDKQKEIAELNRLMEKMEDRKAYLYQAIVDEQNAAATLNDPYLFTAAGQFADGADFEIRDLNEAIADAEKIMEKKRDDIRELFLEQKRYDILHKRAEEKAKKEHDKQVQDQLDEIAVLRYNSAF